MDINTIVKRVNKLLAGEQLVYFRLEEFLDSVIDDINSKLNSKFPAFSEVYEPLNFDYNYFPEQYIRSVVIPGAAYKFYIMDEEGMATAEQFGYDYEKALFMMMRDYLDDVPEEYQAESKGSVVLHEDWTAARTPFRFNIW
jgi:hypothetical protein